MAKMTKRTECFMARTIGFIGLGLMGRGMARTLIRKGHRVSLYNRTRAKAEEVASLGGKVAATPAEAAREAEVVFTMVSDPPALFEVVESKDGILDTIRPGAVVIDSSTVSPQATLRVAERLKAKGASMLDAPVFGSKNEAESGQLGFMIGGDRKVFDSVQDLFEGCLGKSARYIGPQGMGAYAKLVFNLTICIMLQGLNEGLTLAAKAGIDPGLMYDVLMGGRAKAGIFEFKGPSVLQRDFTPFFPLKLMNKDLKLALDAAHALAVPMPALAAIKEVFSSAMAAGQAEEDFSSTIKVLERQAGVEVKRRS